MVAACFLLLIYVTCRKVLNYRSSINAWSTKPDASASPYASRPPAPRTFGFAHTRDVDDDPGLELSTLVEPDQERHVLATHGDAAGWHDCLTMRADVLFELADAVLSAPTVTSLPYRSGPGAGLSPQLGQPV